VGKPTTLNPFASAWQSSMSGGRQIVIASMILVDFPSFNYLWEGN
jgi:hypothetical protein